MAANGHSACNAGVWMDSNAGVLTNVSGHTNQVNIAFTKKLSAFNTFGNEWENKTECGKAATIDFKVVFDVGSAHAYGFIRDWFQMGGKRTCRIELPEPIAGADRIEGEWRLANYSVNAVAGDPTTIMATGQLQSDGAIVTATSVS